MREMREKREREKAVKDQFKQAGPNTLTLTLSLNPYPNPNPNP